MMFIGVMVSIVVAFILFMTKIVLYRIGDSGLGSIRTIANLGYGPETTLVKIFEIIKAMLVILYVTIMIVLPVYLIVCLVLDQY